MVDFAGWQMPVQYPSGIVEEHLTTRRRAGLFDVSHMGRFSFSGHGVVAFLQHALSNNCAGLKAGEAQYTMVPNERGGAIDDAYLYRFFESEYLLVVNASNRARVWEHFQSLLTDASDVRMRDDTDRVTMVSIQGPESARILKSLLIEGRVPPPIRNSLDSAYAADHQVLVARTGYTGEPVGFELFFPREAAVSMWQELVDRGAFPVGLGARDTLRLEAGLPLYGHELGADPGGNEIPIYSCPLSRIAVSLSPLKGEFVGRAALNSQFREYGEIIRGDFSSVDTLSRLIRPFALLDKGVARAGAPVYQNDQQIGWVTSGTMVPYWKQDGVGLQSRFTDDYGLRAIGLALLDCRIREDSEVHIRIRGRDARALVVAGNLRSEAPPYARSMLFSGRQLGTQQDTRSLRREAIKQSVAELLSKTVENSTWRQQECINLIPSEQTHSPLVRLASVMDPSFRYAEHKPVKAFNDADVFYYQGTDFIEEVENRVVNELQSFLGCDLVEPRVISGQMANMVVFSAMVDYLNRGSRKQEQRRIRSVMNNHMLMGGHLSSQPMGALRDFVARDPQTDKPAVVQLPVCKENPFKPDTSLLPQLVEQYRPELVVLGKSMIIHKEPVREIRAILDQLQLDTVLMYDMAHVLGLVGPLFQEPFKEGADLITGSTHKTFFGTQRGVVAADYSSDDLRFPLWESIARRTFPGSVSNHHLGTLLGLLFACYEMNAFKDEYQAAVIRNAKAFALSLSHVGLSVAGDPDIDFTETHQVILRVGYGKGVEMARKLQDNNIIVNYQATPEEEGFTAAGALRLGVSEMTRFGMEAENFRDVAQLIADVIIKDQRVKEAVADLRRGFQDLKFCFTDRQFEDHIQKLHALVG